MEQMPAPPTLRKLEYREPRKLPTKLIAAVVVLALAGVGVYLLLQPAPKLSATITVLTQEGYPIEKAEVKIIGPKNASDTTGSSGTVGKELPAGRYDVTISAFGFNTSSSDFELPGKGSVQLKLEGIGIIAPSELSIAPLDSYAQKITVSNYKADDITVQLDAETAIKKYFVFPEKEAVYGAKDFKITVTCDKQKQAECAPPTAKKEGDKLTFEGKLFVKLLSGTSVKTIISIPVKLIFEKERIYTASPQPLTLTEGQNGTARILISNTGPVPLRNVRASSQDSRVLGFSRGASTMEERCTAERCGIQLSDIGPKSEGEVLVFITSGSISKKSDTFQLIVDLSIGAQTDKITLQLTVQKP